MKTIWKVVLDDQESRNVELPAGAKILSVQVQKGHICLWALCDPSAELVPRQLVMYFTGDHVPQEPLEYLGTIQLLAGALVLHVFEVLQK